MSFGNENPLSVGSKTRGSSSGLQLSLFFACEFVSEHSLQENRRMRKVELTELPRNEGIDI